MKCFTKKYNEEKPLSSYDAEDRKILELLRLFKYDIETLRYVLYTGRVQRTDFIDVTYRSTNPELSAYIVNQIVTEFFRNHESSRNQQTVHNIETLKKLVDQKREELDLKIGNIKTMGTMDVSVESSSKLEQVSNFENRLADEKSIYNSAVLTMQQLSGKLTEIEKTTTQNASAAKALNSELSTAKAQMNDAYNEYVSKGSTT